MQQRNPPSSLRIEEIQRLCGTIADWKIAAIIATGATIADLEAAAALLAGEDEILTESRRPADAPIANVYEILTADEEDTRRDYRDVR